jgi:lysozyme
MNDFPPEQTTACWHIWSGEHGMWWRRGAYGRGEGYVGFLGQAGKWTRVEAEAMTRHCGPEKKIALVPDPYGPDAAVQHDGRHFIDQRVRECEQDVMTVKPQTTPGMYDLFHGDRLASPNYAGDTALFAKALTAGWPWLIHKLTQGAIFQDPLALGRLIAAARANLLLGVYHFMTSEPVTSQIANLMHSVGLARAAIAPAKLVIVIDNEPVPATPATDAAASAVADAIRVVTGRWPLLYGNRFNFFSAKTVGSLAMCKLWLAEYGTNPIAPLPWGDFPSTTCPLHQYSDGQVGPNPVDIPGIGKVDQSAFAGRLAELPAFHASLAV